MLDEAHLLDMLLAARRAMTFMENSTADSFRSDHLVQNAVEQVFAELTQFGRWLDDAQGGFEPAKPVSPLY